MCRRWSSVGSTVNSFAMTGGKVLPEALQKFLHRRVAAVVTRVGRNKGDRIR